MLNESDKNGNFPIDEVVFHMTGHVTPHIYRILGAEQPHEKFQYLHDTPEMKVWCGLLYACVIGLFYFAENAIKGKIYFGI
jgi:hypothetical protein